MRPWFCGTLRRLKLWHLLQGPGHLLQGFKTWTKLIPYRTSFSLPSFFNRLCACKFANSHHASFTLYLFYILSHIFTLFNHLCVFNVGFTLFTMLLYFIISQWFSFYTSTIFLRHSVSHSYNVMVSFAFFVFVRHTAHCFLLLVSCMLYVVKKHCPEETHLNRWAKRRLIIKIVRRSTVIYLLKLWHL